MLDKDNVSLQEPDKICCYVDNKGTFTEIVMCYNHVNDVFVVDQAIEDWTIENDLSNDNKFYDDTLASKGGGVLHCAIWRLQTNKMPEDWELLDPTDSNVPGPFSLGKKATKSLIEFIQNYK